MPKQSEDQRPQDGALPKPPRSRFRADGRRRRTSGELKKRAPTCSTGRTSKPSRERERERESERERERKSKPPLTEIVHNTSVSTPTSSRRQSTTTRRSDMGVEAVGGPPLEAPVARNEKGRPEMAPGSPGTRTTGMTTGRIRTAGAGETLTRGTTQTTTGDLRKKKTTKTPKKKTLRTGDISADSRESYENATSESSPICKPRKKNRTPAPPASKRSRSTQVSDEFVRRQQEAESPQTAPTEDLCATPDSATTQGG